MNLTAILLIAGVLFIVIVIVGVISVSIRGNSEDEDDPLQARLAEYLQNGDVTSLEEIELSQPFAERVIIPIVRKIGEISARFTPQKAIQSRSTVRRPFRTRSFPKLSAPNQVPPAADIEPRPRYHR